MKTRPRPLLPWFCTLTALLILASPCFEAHAGTLTWGSGGLGGSGTWNNSSFNWWNGTSNVPWTTGTGVFSGTGGVVSVSTFQVTADKLVFDAPGYTLSGGWFYAGSNGLTVETRHDATIGSTLSGGNEQLVKTGTAALNLVGTNFLGTLQVNEGSVRSSNLFFSNVILADVPGASVTLLGNGSVSIGSLNGGGNNGGFIQPSGTASLTTAWIRGNGSFAGVLQDTGTNKLGLTKDFQTGTFTNTNTYTGPTTASSGTLVFAGNGSALQSSAYSANYGAIRLDNSTTALADRLKNTGTVTLFTGSLELLGNSTNSIEETVGALSFSGNAAVAVFASGTATALLTFSEIIRTSLGTLDINGNGNVGWSGMSNGPSGIIANYLTTGTGTDWATANGNQRVEALTNYQTDPNNAASHEHVKLAGSGITALTTSGTFQTLNLQANGAADQTIDLSGKAVTLETAGLLSSGNRANTLSRGTLTATGSELVIINQNSLTITSTITGSLGLTKGGPGTLTLRGGNSFSGMTTLASGVLAVQNQSSLGTNPTMDFRSGTLRADADFTLSKNINPGSTANIDTNGHTVLLTGSVTSLSKTGDGTLIVPSSNLFTGTVSQGLLQLPSARGGWVSIMGGNLEVSGTLDRLESLNFLGMATLGIGGTGAGTLSLGSYSASGPSPLKVQFGLGSESSDLWTYTGPFFSMVSNGIAFDFDNLGGATTGVAYTLINFTLFSPFMPQGFSFSPESQAEGWAGAFSVSDNKLKVTFSSVPEPGSATIILAMTLGACWRCARRSASRKRRAE